MREREREGVISLQLLYLIASFLIAMHQFSKETFKQGGDLKRITLKEYNIVFMSFETRVFAYVYQGNSYLAMKSLQEFINQISSDKKFWKEFIGIIPVITKDQTEFLSKVIKATFQSTTYLNDEQK